MIVTNERTDGSTAGGRTGRGVRIGLGLAALLAVGDVAAGIVLFGGDPTSTAVAVFGWFMALATFAALPAGWRGAGRALRTVAVTRLLGALTAVPAYFVPGVPTGLVITAAVTVLAAVLAAVLILRAARVQA